MWHKVSKSVNSTSPPMWQCHRAVQGHNAVASPDQSDVIASLIPQLMLAMPKLSSGKPKLGAWCTRHKNSRQKQSVGELKPWIIPRSWLAIRAASYVKMWMADF